MRKCKSIILTLLVSFISMTMYAQDFICSGTIVDELGEPIIGASVFQTGSKNGVFSDINGEFKLAQVPEGSSITISYIGYKTIETKAAAGIRIVMHEDNELLGEVVVVGYGVISQWVTTSRRVSLAAISTVPTISVSRCAATPNTICSTSPRSATGSTSST